MYLRRINRRKSGKNHYYWALKLCNEITRFARLLNQNSLHDDIKNVMDQIRNLELILEAKQIYIKGIDFNNLIKFSKIIYNEVTHPKPWFEEPVYNWILCESNKDERKIVDDIKGLKPVPEDLVNKTLSICQEEISRSISCDTGKIKYFNSHFLFTIHVKYFIKMFSIYLKKMKLITLY